jgi:RNA polymerase sigma-70 factor, ECF subfamily
VITVEDFEAARPQLLSVAHRILGSTHDAQDAVQSTWLRATSARADAGAEEPVANPAGWLTTITARICLDELRARRRRGELPLLADAIPADELSADEAVIRADDVSRALMVLLDQLTPPQRVAYVLHDLFAVPFDHIAVVLDSTVPNAKKHASRARQRLDRVDPEPGAVASEHADRVIVDAFLTAARTGDTRAMIGLLAPDCVRDADAALVPPGIATVVTGATTVAEETKHFVDRIRMTCPLVINGSRAHLIAPGGHPLAGLHIDIDDGRISRITLRAVQRDDHFAAA